MYLYVLGLHVRMSLKNIFFKKDFKELYKWCIKMLSLKSPILYEKMDVVKILDKIIIEDKI